LKLTGNGGRVTNIRLPDQFVTREASWYSFVASKVLLAQTMPSRHHPAIIGIVNAAARR
jgi:hypothetical protein